jgi:hypothetical protein
VGRGGDIYSKHFFIFLTVTLKYASIPKISYPYGLEVPESLCSGGGWVGGGWVLYDI